MSVCKRHKQRKKRSKPGVKSTQNKYLKPDPLCAAEMVDEKNSRVVYTPQNISQTQSRLEERRTAVLRHGMESKWMRTQTDKDKKWCEKEKARIENFGNKSQLR